MAQPSEKLTGEISRWKNDPAEDSGWHIAWLRAADGREVKLQGHHLPRPGVGVVLDGHFTVHERWGAQFDVSSYECCCPASIHGLVTYLADVVPGVGPTTAQRLALHFKEDVQALWHAILHEHALLCAAGISADLAERIHEVVEEDADEASHRATLRGWGLTPLQIGRCKTEWKHLSAALDAVQRDPYELAYRIERIGFATADDIRKNMGIPDSHPCRVEAIVLLTLKEAAENDGHVFGDRGLLEMACAHYKLDYVSQLKPALDSLEARKRIVKDDGKYIYLRALHIAETTIADYASFAVAAREDVVPFDIPDGCPDCGEHHWSMEIDREQRELDCSQTLAAQRMVSRRNRLAITTGGPGTGKTSVLRAALDALDEIGATYLLGAPTGKAAKRMSEATGRKAFTLHTLLKIRPSNGWFYGGGVSQGPEVAADYIFVDEASMIDTMLMAELIGRLGDTRLRLIGDANQLPPVGPGQPFNDFITSGHVPVSRLTKLHRAAAKSWIAVNAPRVLAGQLPDLAPQWEPGQDPDFFMVECSNSSAIGSVVQGILTDDTKNWIRDHTVAALSPQKKGPAGVIELNTLLHDTLNPYNAEAPERLEISEHEELRLGSTVMITRNDSKRGLVNGDIGTIVYMEANMDGTILEVQVGDVVGDEDPSRRYRYSRKEAAADLTLAYCFTVHKAQGSEYEWVIIVCHPRHRMTTRRLFYTAITRAKRGVILVGTRDGVQHAVTNTADKQRLTRLVERMNAKQLNLDLIAEGAHGRLH
jgi:exodeoxyribonuclease V alpha subunit